MLVLQVYWPTIGMGHLCHNISIKRENSQPITSWHIILPSSQSMTNYKTSHIATSFHYSHSETNRDLSSGIQIKE